MSTILVYDDTLHVPDEVSSAIGISRFGELLYRRATLASRAHTYAASAHIDRILHLRTESDVRDTLDRSRHWDGNVIYLPANLVPRDFDRFVTLLKKLCHADPGCVLMPDGSSAGLALMSPRRFRNFAVTGLLRGRPSYLADRISKMVALPNYPDLADLSNTRAFLDYLTGQFQARFFNRIAFDSTTVEKRSSDKDKMRREYQYYGFLPERMQPYFLRPFDFRETASDASYQLERLYIPDVAVQWVHDAMSLDEFRAFLDVVFRFLAIRERRPATSATLSATSHLLYLDKLDARIAALQATPAYDVLSDLLRHGTPWGGLDQLVVAYKSLYHRSHRPASHNYLCVCHGDLCFSNILYDKRLRLMRLIDPRGADTADGLYSDPYYDIAKLSHSIAGGYDYLTQGLFDVGLNERLQLTLQRTIPNHRAKRRIFQDKLAEFEFDYRLVRLYEASLFLSMLPLHLENHRKLLGFVLTAAEICAELSSSLEGSRSHAA